jgi:hypothetical protein
MTKVLSYDCTIGSGRSTLLDSVDEIEGDWNELCIGDVVIGSDISQRVRNINISCYLSFWHF